MFFDAANRGLWSVCLYSRRRVRGVPDRDRFGEMGAFNIMLNGAVAFVARSGLGPFWPAVQIPTVTPRVVRNALSLDSRPPGS